MMGDPVTMAVIGGSMGALMNEDDPLMGALMGAAGGYGSSVLLGGTAVTAAGLTPAAAGTTAGTAGGSAITAGAGGSAAGNLTAVPSFGAPSFQVGASAVPSAGVFANPAQVSAFQPLTYNQATAAGMQRPFSTAESLFNPNIQSSSMAPTFTDQLKSGANEIGQFAQQNPVLTQMGMQTAQQMMQEQPTQMAPAGQVSRGQIQGGDFMSLLNPQQGQVIRPQPISLLG